MISELNDEDILDFLMSSDLNGDYSPDELKYLLLKWRYFYRGLHGKLSRSKDERDGDTRKLSEEILGLKDQITKLQMKSANLENTISSIENRSLTWKERISGKIITKKDEDPGIQEA